MSLLLKFNLILVLVFAIALAPTAYLTNRMLQQNARTQVVEQARLMMQTAMATRNYTSKQIKPLLAPRLAEEFLPQTVPAYSATEIFNLLHVDRPQYTYKEATLNPTNPRDRTTDWEADIVNAFRSDPHLTELTGEREGPLGSTLYLARPIQITDPGCLACHTSAAVAPPSLVKAYGPSNGFGWKLNDIIGAQVVSVPTAVATTMANGALHALLASLAGVFAFIMLFLNVLLWFAVIRPIRRLSAMADEISVGNFDAPEVAVTGSDEVSTLAKSFQRMRVSLVKAIKMLEDS
jgi:protein-histidine pros-kinase